jgi:hypothetical protein
MSYIAGPSTHRVRVMKAIFMMVLVLCLSACASADITSSTGSALAMANALPNTVYIADFQLQADDIRSEGPLSNVDRTPLLGRVLPYSPLMIHSSKSDRAKHLAALMNSSITNDLKERGFHVGRLVPGQPTPSTGWLVSGEFLTVDEGDRAKRALVGFGAGHSNLVFRAYVTDLADPTAKQPLLSVTTDARSGKTPGAVLGFNPFAAGAGFVLAGLASDNDVKNSASKLSDEIVRRLLPNEQESRKASPIT